MTDRSTPPDGEAALPVPETAVTPPRRRRRRVLIALLSALGVLGAVGLGIWFYADWQIERNIEWIDDPFAALPSRPPVSTPSTRDQPVTSTTAPGTSGTTEGPQDSSAVRRGDPVNLLFLGSDSRISAGDPSLWQAGAQRTDAIMLVHIPSHREEIFVMSIPRDSWVPVPGHGDAKINAAFSYGGPSLLVQTFEQLTGVRIDHLAVVDFASFVELTDMFGGVEITIPETTYDRRRGEVIPAGTYQMNGEEALDYARQRYGLPGGDLDRVRRHQNWLRAVALKAMDLGALDNPAEITKILLAVSDHVATDEGFTVGSMRDLAYSLRGIERPQDMHFVTAPIAGLGTSPDGAQSIVRLDHPRLEALCEAIAQDRAEEFLDRHPDDYVTLGESVR